MASTTTVSTRTTMSTGKLYFVLYPIFSSFLSLIKVSREILYINKINLSQNLVVKKYRYTALENHPYLVGLNYTSLETIVLASLTQEEIKYTMHILTLHVQELFLAYMISLYQRTYIMNGW